MERGMLYIQTNEQNAFGQFVSLALSHTPLQVQQCLPTTSTLHPAGPQCTSYDPPSPLQIIFGPRVGLKGCHVPHDRE